MTALLPDANLTVVPTGSRRLMHGVGEVDLTRHDAHASLRGTMPRLDSASFVAAVERTRLRGRGGAGFPFAHKVKSILGKTRPMVVVNGTEGEPASSKDRVLLHFAPHLVLDGAVATADAIGSKRIIVAVTKADTRATLASAIATRPDAARFDIRLVPDRFIIGEATALISALNGGPALPPGRRTLPTVAGVDGKPTLLSNAETFAHVALIVRHGADWFTSIGTPDEPGTVLLTVGGAVGQPGVIEVATGTTLGDVARQAAAFAPQAVVVGGYHGGWVPYDPSMRLARHELSSRGASLGAGVLLFVGSDTCALSELARVTRWLAGESAKQCGPCLFGLPALADDVQKAARGIRPPDLATHLQVLPGRGACAHPDGAVRFVRSGLALLGPELAAHEHHANHGTCGRADRGHLPTPGVRA